MDSIKSQLQTLKLTYHTESTEDMEVIRKYRRQYSSLLRWMYNRCVEEMPETDRKHAAKHLNNVGLLDSWFIASAAKDANARHLASPDTRVVFGGKKDFIRRCKGLIDREEWLKKKLQPLCSIGEAAQKANRKFRIKSDMSGITFQPDRYTRIDLAFDGLSRNYRRILSKLYLLQEAKATPITYKLSDTHVFISFDESVLRPEHAKPRRFVENRVMAIDLNPNYIGWSVVDWKSSCEYKVIATGIYDIKEINDRHFDLSGQKVPSTDKRNIYLNNKRRHEVMEISKNLVNTARHYGCELFACEELNIESSDKGKGGKYNALVNNMWCRDKLVQNLSKRCNLSDIRFREVKANYSSFVGNVVFRKVRQPDMVLASIEIGRRAYEFEGQYKKKNLKQRKNIVLPDDMDFSDDIAVSLEEFGMSEGYQSLKGLYDSFKKSKFRYRLSFEEADPPPRFSRCFSKRALILRSLTTF